MHLEASLVLQFSRFGLVKFYSNITICLEMCKVLVHPKWGWQFNG